MLTYLCVLDLTSLCPWPRARDRSTSRISPPITPRRQPSTQDQSLVSFIWSFISLLNDSRSLKAQIHDKTLIYVSALFASKKKLSVRPRFSPDASLRGALSWAVVVEDCSTNTQLEAFIAISSDSLVIIQDNPHRDVLFITPCKWVDCITIYSIVIPMSWPSVSNGLYRLFPPPTCS